MAEELAGSDESALVEVELPHELESASGMTGAIYAAIDAQRPAAVAYVKRLRRRQPDASPAELVISLERHYVVAVTASGGAVGATAFFPGAGTAVALGAGAAELLLQFELAALFGLANAEVHGLKIPDRDRARALILTLMLGQEGRSKVASLARAAISKDASGLAGVAGRTGKTLDLHSLETLPLADLLGLGIPNDFVPALLGSVQGMAKDKVPAKVGVAGARLLPGGIGVLIGGVGGYATGRDVVAAAQQSFGSPPDKLPEWLEPSELDSDDPGQVETAMRGAVGAVVQVGSTATGAVAMAATAAAGGVSAGARATVNSFRSVDLDGDGIPDEARALTAAKGAGRAATNALGSARGAAGSLFRGRRGGNDEAPESEG